MSIVLSPESQEQISELVRSGQFASADDFIRKSVERHREDRAWLEKLAGQNDVQRQIDDGLRAFREGRYGDYDSDGLRALAEQIKREGRIEMGLPVDAP